MKMTKLFDERVNRNQEKHSNAYLRLKKHSRNVHNNLKKNLSLSERVIERFMFIRETRREASTEMLNED